MEEEMSILRDKSKCREDNGGMKRGKEPQRVKLALQMFQKHQEKKKPTQVLKSYFVKGRLCALTIVGDFVSWGSRGQGSDDEGKMEKGKKDVVRGLKIWASAARNFQNAKTSKLRLPRNRIRADFRLLRISTPRAP